MNSPLYRDICNILAAALVGADVIPSFVLLELLDGAGIDRPRGLASLTLVMQDLAYSLIRPPLGRVAGEAYDATGCDIRSPRMPAYWTVPGRGRAYFYVVQCPSDETKQRTAAWFASEYARSEPPKKAYRNGKSNAKTRRARIAARLARLEPEQKHVRAWIAEYVKLAGRPDRRRNPDNASVMKARRAAYSERIEQREREAARQRAAEFLKGAK